MKVGAIAVLVLTLSGCGLGGPEFYTRVYTFDGSPSNGCIKYDWGWMRERGILMARQWCGRPLRITGEQNFGHRYIDFVCVYE